MTRSITSPKSSVNVNRSTTGTSRLRPVSVFTVLVLLVIWMAMPLGWLPPLVPRDLLAVGLQKAHGKDGPPEVVRADPFPGRIVGQKDVILLDVGMALGCPPGIIMLRFLPTICH